MNELILIGLFFCHFLADYTHLSTAWMLNAKRLGKPFFPIWVHAMVHGLLMFWTILFFTKSIEFAGYGFLFQWLTHFVVDVWKGRMNGWFPKLQDNTNKWHWIIFGFDQFLHATVIVIMYHFIVN